MRTYRTNSGYYLILDSNQLATLKMELGAKTDSDLQSKGYHFVR